VDAATSFRNVLAVDRRGRRVMALSEFGDGARRFGVRAGDLQEFLASQGYEDAVALTEATPLLLPEVGDRRERDRSGAVLVALALAAVPREAPLRVAAGPEGLHRVNGMIISGTRREFPHNFPRALVDRDLGPTEGMGEFWASSFVAGAGPATGEGSPNTVTLMLPRPIPVAAIEFVHAEASGFSPRFNLKHWRLHGRKVGSNVLMPLLDMRHERPVGRERLAIEGAPVLQSLVLEIVEPNFFPSGNTARIAELMVWSPERVIGVREPGE
jgi:hypothetical protein